MTTKRVPKPIVIQLNPNKVIEWKVSSVGSGGREIILKKSKNWDYRNTKGSK